MIKYLYKEENYTLDELMEVLEDDLQYNNELYNEWLDELGDVSIGGYTYPHSLALERVDPVAYRVGFNDWTDSELRYIMDEVECLDNGDTFSHYLDDIYCYDTDDIDGEVIDGCLYI